MLQDATVLPVTEPQSRPSTRAAWRYLPIAVVMAGLAFGYAMGWHEYFSLMFLAEKRDVLNAYVADHYPFSLAVFFALYTAAVAFSFPVASALTVFGGFLFGWLVAGAVVAVAATLGASLLFLAARSALCGFLTRGVGGKVADLAAGFEKDAFGYLLVLRLAPIFPFFVMNIAPALFNVSLRAYVAATFLGILPGTFAYAWLGQGVDSVLEAAQASGEEPSIGDLVTPEITLAFAALALVAAIPTVVRKLRARKGG